MAQTQSEYTVEQLQQMLDQKRSEATPHVAVTQEELCALGACTYWLASMYRNGVCLPKGIGREVCQRAYLLRAGLLLSPTPKLYGVPPLPIPYRAVFQFTDAAGCQQAMRFLCMLGLVTLMDKNQVKLEVK